MYDVNNDFAAWLHWDSGIISEPVVMTNDYNYYLNHNANKEYDTMGSLFIMDDNDIENDTNVVIYGHAVFYTVDTFKLTPLLKMLDQSYLEENDTFTIYWENEKKTYQAILAADVNTYDVEAWNYEIANFTNIGDFQTWIGKAKKAAGAYIDTDLSMDDHYITFQTCKSMYSSQRVVVLAKEVSSSDYR